MLSFFFHDTATTEIYTLSLHDALPISGQHRKVCRSRTAPLCLYGLPATASFHGAVPLAGDHRSVVATREPGTSVPLCLDRKSTRLNSSHSQISYAVFCLKKKKKK